MRIDLTRGYFTEVDDELGAFLAQYKWSVSGSPYAYAKRGIPKHPPVFMHHIVLGFIPLPPYVTDHIDGNTLNNRRINLRAITYTQNAHASLFRRGYRWINSHGQRVRVELPGPFDLPPIEFRKELPDLGRKAFD